MILLFQSYDEKSAMWERSLRALGVEAASHRLSPILAPLKLVRIACSHRERGIYVFRYLNDERALLKSLLRAASEALVVGLCTALRWDVWWIVHNIDRETFEHHPRLTRLRRNLLLRRAKRLFVTDPRLVALAETRMGRSFDWLCFGPPQGDDASRRDTEFVREKIVAFRELLEKRYGVAHVMIGYCATAVNAKHVHIFNALRLVERATADGIVTGVVLIGDFRSARDASIREALERLRNDDRILLLEQWMALNDVDLGNEIDFFYRSLCDLSVPYTAYVALASGRPMVTDEVGFLPELVRGEGLGWVVPLGEAALAEPLLEFLRAWKPDDARAFFQTRGWHVAAQRLARATTRDVEALP